MTSNIFAVCTKSCTFTKAPLLKELFSREPTLGRLQARQQLSSRISSDWSFSPWLHHSTTSLFGGPQLLLSEKWSHVMMKWRVSKNSDLSTHRISFVPREHIKSLQLQHFAVRQRRHHRNYGVWRVCEYDKHPLTSDSNPVRPLSVFCRYFSLFTKVFYSTFI